jgi:hypothetical protein
MMEAFAGASFPSLRHSLTRNQNHESELRKAKESTVPPHRFQSSLRRACIVAAFLLAGGHILAQQDSGGILVTVQDASGAVVANASATVVNNDTQAISEGKTNAIGIWNATPLPPGDYRVTVSQTGFETSVAEHVTVQIQQNTRLPITLKVGSTNQSLVVQAQASLLQTEDVSVGQTISGVLKDDLPVSDRDFNRLAVLTVGVNYSTPSGPRDTASGAFSANGISQYQNNYILDGTDNNSYDQNINEGPHLRHRAFAGRNLRVQRIDQLIFRRVWTRRRRGRYCQYKIRDKPPARLGLRVLPNQRFQHQRLLQQRPGDQQDRLSQKHLWSLCGRTGGSAQAVQRTRQDIFLCRL